MKALTAFSLGLISTFSYAAPFVLSDPTAEAVTGYSCSIDGGADQASVPESVTGGVRVKFDLAALTTGAHVITCKALNTLWGIASAASLPLSVTKPASLLAPRNITIAP